MDNCITVALKSHIPDDKTRFNLLLPKDLNQEFRDYVFKKYHGYRRGAFTKEFELAIKNLVASEREKNTKLKNQNNDLFADMESLVKAVREHITICPVFREELKKIVGLPDQPKEPRELIQLDR